MTFSCPSLYQTYQFLHLMPPMPIGLLICLSLCPFLCHPQSLHLFPSVLILSQTPIHYHLSISFHNHTNPFYLILPPLLYSSPSLVPQYTSLALIEARPSVDPASVSLRGSPSL